MPDSDKTLDSFRKAIRKNTKLIVCTASSNVWGIKLPFERISALCKLYDIKFCLDASQAAGLIPINMKENSIDFLCFPAHKSLYGIMGLGVMMIKDENSLEPFIFGGTGVNSLSELQPENSPEKYESGTLNLPGILALSEGINFVKSKGVSNILKYETEKIRYIYDSFKNNRAIKLYTERPDTNNFVPVLSFNTSLPSETMGEYYNNMGIALRCGLHCAPLAHKKLGTEKTGTIRISPSVFTSDNDIELFIKKTNLIINKAKL